jgi:pimeloyl-ACP methyl ester carboxylesterase
MKEEAVSFSTGGGVTGIITDAVLHGGARANLVGDETVPLMAAPPTRPAFLFLNAGVTHHVGPNGLYVRMARALAQQGFPSLRFDYSGLGDSGRRADAMPAAESVAIETSEAMDLLVQTRGVKSFVPIGICSGAINAFVAAQSDVRVSGAVLINAQMHLHGFDPGLGEQLHARAMARHSWRIALKSSFRSKNWKKAVGGQLTPGRILSMMVGAPARAVAGRFRTGGAGNGAGDTGGVTDPLAMLQALTDRGVHLYHIYCEGDEGLDYFNTVLGKGVEQVRTGERSRFEVIPGANHVFTLLWSQDELVKRVCNWAQELPVVVPAATSGA